MMPGPIIITPMPSHPASPPRPRLSTSLRASLSTLAGLLLAAALVALLSIVSPSLRGSVLAAALALAVIGLAWLDARRQQQADAMACTQLDHFHYDARRQRLHVGTLARHWMGATASARWTLQQLLPDDSDQRRQLHDALLSPAAMDIKLRLSGADGRLRTLQLRSPAQAEPALRRSGAIQDVSAAEQAHDTLARYQHDINALAHTLPDALLIVHDGVIAYRNPAAAQLLGPDPGDGQPLQQVLPQLQNPPPAQAHSLRVQLDNASGSASHALVTVAPFVHEGEPSHLILIRDITQTERTRRQLQASNQELQAMTQRLFSVQEDERRAISRDLHDDIGQAITAMKLAAHAAIDEPDLQRRNEDLGLLLEMADQTVGRLRDLSTLLRPPQLDALGLEAALSWQVRTILRNRQIDYQVDVPPLSQRPAALCEQTCFRIAQESLTNIVRHAHAGSVSLSLEELPDARMRLYISDDGDGFEPDGPRGLGLAVMRERAHGVGGHLHIDTAPGAGTRITCHLPFQPATASQPGHPAA